MQKIISAALLLMLASLNGFSQKISAPINFGQGDSIAVTVNVKQVVAQQTGPQAIDFHVDGIAHHSYKVSNSTDDNATLHHAVHRMQFNFDGMGQKRGFDSDTKKDIEGPFGKPMKEILSKEFDMIVDRSGKTLLVRPEKIELEKPDPRFALIAGMLKDVIHVVYPPLKGAASIFKVLPAEGAAIGETWQETFKTESESGITTYTLSAVTDSTIIVDFKTIASSTSTTEMMGMQTVTTMKSNMTGQIIADKASGLIREKNSTVESNGATEAMGNSLPMTARTTINMVVTRFPAQ